MKIKAKNPNVASMKLIVPIDGLITIDAAGVAEVSPKCAVLLVNNTNDWQYEGTSPKNTAETTEQETGAEGTENDAKTERELLEEKVREARVAELKEMCSEAGFPEEEWKNLSKGLIGAYILKKYDEAIAATASAADDEEED